MGSALNAWLGITALVEQISKNANQVNFHIIVQVGAQAALAVNIKTRLVTQVAKCAVQVTFALRVQPERSNVLIQARIAPKVQIGQL